MQLVPGKPHRTHPSLLLKHWAYSGALQPLLWVNMQIALRCINRSRQVSYMSYCSCCFLQLEAGVCCGLLLAGLSIVGALL
jgi:hypothetical protein